jgi:hypothetical protein
VRSGIGLLGGQRPSSADYVTLTGAKEGGTASGWSGCHSEACRPLPLARPSSPMSPRRRCSSSGTRAGARRGPHRADRVIGALTVRRRQRETPAAHHSDNGEKR